MLIVLTGKTASGKDTIKNTLLSKYPDLLRVITTTSRTPRKNEKNGTEYHFLSPEKFQEAINEGKFIEYVNYGGNFYGTQKKDIENYLDRNLLWRIDPSRAGEAREFIKRAFAPEVAEKLISQLIVIYITTSEEVILKRLKSRNLSDSEIEKRMTDDAQIWEKYQGDYDFVIDNVPGHLNETFEKVIQIVEAEYNQ